MSRNRQGASRVMLSEVKPDSPARIMTTRSSRAPRTMGRSSAPPRSASASSCASADTTVQVSIDSRSRMARATLSIARPDAISDPESASLNSASRMIRLDSATSASGGNAASSVPEATMVSARSEATSGARSPASDCGSRGSASRRQMIRPRRAIASARSA